jgi:hypothetical protein
MTTVVHPVVPAQRFLLRKRKLGNNLAAQPNGLFTERHFRDSAVHGAQVRRINHQNGRANLLVGTGNKGK